MNCRPKTFRQGFVAIVAVAIGFGVDSASAATRTWSGATSTRWHTASNWSGGAVPTPNDKVVFDGTAGNDCVFTSNVSVLEMVIASDFPGVVMQGTGASLTIGSNGFSQSGGTFVGGSNVIDCNGVFAVSGGEFTSTSGTLYVYKNFTISGGSFQHNNGTIALDGWDKAVSVGSAVLRHLVIDTGGNSVTTTGAIALAGDLTLKSVNYLNGGTIAVAGNVTTYDTQLIGYPGTEILFNGAGDQLLTSAATGGLGLVTSVHVNKPSGTLTLQGPVGIFNHWTHTSGTVNTGSQPLHFVGFDKTVTAGTMSYKDVVLNTGGNSIAVSGTMTVTGNLTIQSVNYLNGGTIAVAGNVIALDPSINGYPGATLLFNGIGDQTLSAGGAYGMVTSVSINKPSGTLTLHDRIGVHQNWTHTAGTVDAGTSEVDFVNFDKTINAPGMSFQNVVIATGGNSVTVTGTMNVLGDFTINSVNYFQGGSINIGGHLTSNASSIQTWQAVTLILNGATDQLITTGSGAVFPKNILINKVACTGGEVKLAGNLSLTRSGQTLDVSEGTLNIEGHTLTVNGSANKLIVEQGGLLRFSSGASIVTNMYSPELQCGSQVESIGVGIFANPPSIPASYSGLAGNSNWTLTGSCLSADTPEPCAAKSYKIVKWGEIRNTPG